MKAEHYIGKDCEFHPELNGLRHGKYRVCMGCHRDSRATKARMRRSERNKTFLQYWLNNAHRFHDCLSALQFIARQLAVADGVHHNKWREYENAACEQIEALRDQVAPGAVINADALERQRIVSAYFNQQLLVAKAEQAKFNARQAMLAVEKAQKTQ